MIRNIVFDMGNVLVVFDPNVFMDREGILDPEDRRIVYQELFHSVEWAQMDLGVLTEKTAEPFIMERIPAHLAEQVRHLLYHWWEKRLCIDGMEDLARRIKQAGYRLYLLSNASTSQHLYWPLFSVSNLFDGKLISCDVKTVKPCPRIYRLFEEKFSLRPDECLFIDDQTANVAAAVERGWKGIVFQGTAEALEKKLSEYGVFPAKE